MTLDQVGGYRQEIQAQQVCGNNLLDLVGPRSHRGASQSEREKLLEDTQLLGVVPLEFENNSESGIGSALKAEAALKEKESEPSKEKGRDADQVKYDAVVNTVLDLSKPTTGLAGNLEQRLAAKAALDAYVRAKGADAKESVENKFRGIEKTKGMFVHDNKDGFTLTMFVDNATEKSTTMYTMKIDRMTGMAAAEKYSTADNTVVKIPLSEFTDVLKSMEKAKTP